MGKLFVYSGGKCCGIQYSGDCTWGGIEKLVAIIGMKGWGLPI